MGLFDGGFDFGGIGDWLGNAGRTVGGWSGDDWMKGLGALGTGAGILGGGFNIYNQIQQGNIMNRIRAEQEAAARRQRDTAMAPLEPGQFTNLLSGAETDAYTRALKADFASRGVPLDSGYVSNEIARMLAETQGQRQQQGINAAQAYRGSQLQGAGAAPGYPQFPQGMNADISPIFRYMMMQKLLGGQQQPQQPQRGPVQQPAQPGAADQDWQMNEYQYKPDTWGMSGYGDAGVY